MKPTKSKVKGNVGGKDAYARPLPHVKLTFTTHAVVAAAPYRYLLSGLQLIEINANPVLSLFVAVAASFCLRF